MGRKLFKTEAKGWYGDASDPLGRRVRKQDGDTVFDTLAEAKITSKKEARPSKKEEKAAPEKTELSTGQVATGKTITIKCQWKGCKNTRVIKPQDAFQVKYCVEHRDEHAREKRNAAARARTQRRKEAAAKSK